METVGIRTAQARRALAMCTAALLLVGVAAAVAGCPPPPRPPSRPSTPWHPAVLVPDTALPQPAAPAPRLTDLSALAGKGMWIWKYRLTEQGDAGRIVARAQQAGLHQLWVRIADS